MLSEELYRHYQDLQAYVDWDSADVERVRVAGPVVEPQVVALVDDFYAELVKHPAANQVIRGGAAQIERLKGTLRTWLRQLFLGDYGADYVNRRWRVGLRHVEIGLDQTYTNVALSRLRSGIAGALMLGWSHDRDQLLEVLRSLNKLLDLDLAIIELAYQTEFQRRQQQAERLATIGKVAGGVAHEIRNPLNVIKTSVYFLLHAKNPSAEKVSSHLARIERQVGAADDVVTALNNFARMAAPELKPVVLGDLLAEVLELNPVGDQITTHVELPGRLPAVLGDANQLRIVFGNLVRNARDAMSTGGTLRISAKQDDSAVQIEVADSGAGIRPDEIGKVMEPLYSTKARGIGLGLTISQAIVEKHSGKLTVASEPGKGATFFVRLAAAVDAQK